MSIKRLLNILGPGLLYAGAAIGVSHLVQSTRAGASYGFELVLVLIIANVLKYPFFQFGPRYAVATGRNLIEGYRIIGRWALFVFAFFTIATVFAIQAAVTIVTAGLIANVFHIDLNDVQMSGIILFITMIILLIGRYGILDKLIKLVIVLLALSTIVAVSYAVTRGYHPFPESARHFNIINRIDFLFLIAFIGWMPAPIDVSVWHSLWSNAKKESLGFSPTLRQSLADFNIGYWGTVFLAICFLSLGAMVMYSSGTELSSQGVEFAGQLISMYTTTIGRWAYPVIAIAAITTMFSTTMTCLDAYPRVLQPTTELLFPRIRKKYNSWPYRIWMVIVVAGTLILMQYLASTMRFMVDLATTLSFVTAPVLAYLTYKVVTHPLMPAEAKPGKFLRIFSWTGIVFLGIFSLVFIVWRFFI